MGFFLKEFYAEITNSKKYEVVKVDGESNLLNL